MSTQTPPIGRTPRGHKTYTKSQLTCLICHIMKGQGRTRKLHQRATRTISLSSLQLLIQYSSACACSPDRLSCMFIRHIITVYSVVSTSVCMKFSHLILRKIIKFVATRCQILRPKCTKFNFGLQRSRRSPIWI